MQLLHQLHAGVSKILSETRTNHRALAQICLKEGIDCPRTKLDLTSGATVNAAGGLAFMTVMAVVVIVFVAMASGRRS